MNVEELKKILNTLPPSCAKFGVISVESVQAVANGFMCVSVPVNSVALDLHKGEVLLVDEKQASVIHTVGAVSLQKV